MSKKVYTELSTHNYGHNGNERNLIPELGSEFVIGALITLATFFQLQFQTITFLHVPTIV